MTERRNNYLFKEMKIIENLLADNQYFKDKQFKNQIVIHHTAGGGSGVNTIHGWNFNPEKVGTAYVIDSLGIVYKAFEPQYWAYHLGLKSGNNIPLNKGSIGIEICNWGQLTLKDGKFKSYVDKVVDESEVCELPTAHRGYKYYHNYTDAQITSAEKLLRFWGKKYNIPLTYNPDIFDINKRALSGEPGVYTHNCVRYDKVDIYPHPKLIEMLKSL